MAALLGAAAPSLPTGIKVTGSNGKGSTCAMAAAVLRAHGLRVGLYTSPHLLAVNERIVVGTAAIPGDELERVLHEVEHRAERIGRSAFGAFEILTAAAATWFVSRGVDVAVWEAGMGGRLDATRVIPAPVTVLVDVALEHTALLGSDREAIAADKAQLCDPASVLVIGPSVPPVEPPGGATALVARDAWPYRVATNLAGEHQRENARCALVACRALLGPRFDRAAAESAILGVDWPGRFQMVRLPHVDAGPDVYVDVAHNPSGLRCVAETAAAVASARPIVLVLGVSAGRDLQSMVGAIRPAASAVLCTSARHRGRPAEEVAAAWGYGALVEGTVEAAVQRAVAIARASGGMVLVTGGLFVAAEALAVSKGIDPASLRFL